MRNKEQVLCLGISAMVLFGCATHMTKPESAPTSSKVLFREFQHVELKPVSLTTEDAKYPANQKAQKKINELLIAAMTKSFPNVKRVESFSAENTKTLQITPAIEQIKFIGGSARFWVGAMAGSSAVKMKVEYKDASNGMVIANPEFYEDANAWGGAWSVGGSDNAMLDRIVIDIANYTGANQ